MIPYLKYHPTAFDPETISLLSGALNDAWRQVDADKAAYKVDGHAEGAREMLARHIVDMAKQGERNPDHLIRGALFRLRGWRLGWLKSSSGFPRCVFRVYSETASVGGLVIQTNHPFAAVADRTVRR